MLFCFHAAADSLSMQVIGWGAHQQLADRTLVVLTQCMQEPPAPMHSATLAMVCLPCKKACCRTAADDPAALAANAVPIMPVSMLWYAAVALAIALTPSHCHWSAEVLSCCAACCWPAVPHQTLLRHLLCTTVTCPAFCCATLLPTNCLEYGLNDKQRLCVLQTEHSLLKHIYTRSVTNLPTSPSVLSQLGPAVCAANGAANQ
jgi:hypothetical protein